jgi:hypothetical protein
MLDLVENTMFSTSHIITDTPLYNHSDEYSLPKIIVKNLPNGTPCISATTGEVDVLKNDENVYEYHDLLLRNDEYTHTKVSDIFIEYMNIHVVNKASKQNSTLKHCPVSFEKNLSMLEYINVE